MNLEHEIVKESISVAFVWAPFVNNVTQYLSKRTNFFDYSRALIFVSATLWDTLHTHDIEKYKRDLNDLEIFYSSNLPTDTLFTWILPLPVQDAKLKTVEKKKYMNSESVKQFKDAFLTSTLSNSIILNGGLLIDSTAALTGLACFLC